MVRASIAFFVLALVAYALGAGGIAGLSVEIGKTLLYVFLILAVISFVASLVTGRRGGNILPLVAALSATSLLLFGGLRMALAETTTGEKVSEAVEDTGKSLKKTGRAAKDKACEMVNGKLDCTKQKMVHKMDNIKDEVHDKADDVKKKVN